MKKYIVSIAIPAIILLLSFVFVTSQTQAQVTDCPKGYICTPIVKVSDCPVGYMCTPVVPVQNSCYAFTRNLGVGSHGQDVQQLTTILKNQGYLNSVANQYDETVASAVTSFQENYISEILTPNGLNRGTGYVGIATRAKLNKLCNDTTNTSVSGVPVIFLANQTGKETNSNVLSGNQSNIVVGKNFTGITSVYLNTISGDKDTYQMDFVNVNGTIVKISNTSYIPSAQYYLYVVNSYGVSAPLLVHVSNSQIISTTSPVTITSTPSFKSAITPSCKLTTDKTSYNLGDNIIFSWTSQNATYALWKEGDPTDGYTWLPVGKLPVSGSQQLTASDIGKVGVVLQVIGPNGSGSCSTTMNITNISIDQDTLKVRPNTSFSISGNTSGITGTHTVVIIGPNYSGGTDYNTVNNFLKGESGMTVVSSNAKVYSEKWSAWFGGIPSEGYYSVFIYDNNGKLLKTGTLWVTLKG